MSIFDRDFDQEIAQERTARTRAPAIEQAAHEAALAAARAEARAQGHAEGRAEAEAEMRAARDHDRTAALERIRERLDEMMRGEAAHRAALERQILGYATVTAERLLPEILETRTHARLLAQVRRGLRLGLDAARLAITLPAGDEALRADVAALVAEAGCAGRVALSQQPELAPGALRIAWEGGALDYSFAAICDEILETLRALSRAPIDAEDHP